MGTTASQSCWSVIKIVSIILALLEVCASKYIESVAANIDGPSVKPTDPRNHAHFVPLIAFHCGYRNKFMNESGNWQDDPSSFATCLEGRYDILKYCKRVHPGEDVTNIVEYSHLSHIENWCKVDNGADCKHHFTVRPYRCIVGNFQTESLQVPSKCHFSHVTGRDKCNDYKYWKLRAESECSLKVEEETKQSMKLRSFAILEPCGLEMFRGVEYVCCPKSVEDKIEKVVDLEKDADEDDYDEDEEEEDTSKDKEKDDEEVNDEQDSYFKEVPDNSKREHERFRAAEERLEKRHRKKVTKVIAEWSELFDRYDKMKEKDPRGAEEYKRSMTAKFRKTVAALETENREKRIQIEDVHDERVQASLNEKKRQATHDYRAALAVQVGSANKNNVLRTLKNYIKAEEKDRTYMLNRYRHLLRSNPEAATNFEPVLLHRLRYIDLRINGTLAMLRDFPSLEKEVQAQAVEFWQKYRRDNTPEVSAEEAKEASVLGADEKNECLIRLYKKYYERNHPSTQLAFLDVKPAKSAESSNLHRHLVALKDVLSEKNNDNKKGEALPEDSDEDQFEEDEDRPVLSSTVKLIDGEKANIMTHVVAKKEPLSLPIDENTDDEDDESEESSELKKELSIPIEPIVESLKQDSLPHKGLPALAHDDMLIEGEGDGYYDEAPYSWVSSQTGLAFALMTVVFILFFIVLFIRRRSRTKGFIEVDMCTPDERHVNGMQVNGYENPTYTFFDAKA